MADAEETSNVSAAYIAVAIAIADAADLCTRALNIAATGAMSVTNAEADRAARDLCDYAHQHRRH